MGLDALRYTLAAKPLAARPFVEAIVREQIMDQTLASIYVRGGLANPNNPEVRAMDLLIEHLTPEQRVELAQSGFFSVRTSLTYRVGVSRHGYVQVLLGATYYGQHCIFADRVPIGDEALTKKMLIEANEKRFWEIGYYGGMVPPGFVPRLS